MNLLTDIVSTFGDPQMLHAALVHLPIGLAMFGVPLLLWNTIRRPQSRILDSSLLILYFSAAVLAYWAARVGEQAAAELPSTLPAEVWEQINLHTNNAGRIWLISGVTAAALIPSLFKQRAGIRFTARTGALLMGLTMLLWTLRAEHEGSKLVYVYGIGTPALEIQTHRAQAAPANSTSPLPIAAEAGTPHASTPSAPLSFATDVQPVFTAYCTSCHNSSDAKSGLDLSTLAGLLEGGKKAGPALLLDAPETSPLLLYLRGELQPRMPKDEPPLSADQIALLGRWARTYAAQEIGEGSRPAGAVEGSLLTGNALRTSSRDAWSPNRLTVAPGRDSLAHTTDLRTRIRYDHLATTYTAAAPRQPESGAPNLRLTLDAKERIDRYQRFRRLSLVGPPPHVPAGNPELDHPIDRFIYSSFQQADLRAPKLASDRDFIRRAFLDVVGVYSKFDDVQRFVTDASEEKYEKLIDSLLERHSDYAENWVPQWADALASDTDNTFSSSSDGIRSDFRRWLAKSFERNRPLDEMVLELFKADASAPTGRYILSQSRDTSVLSAADISQVFLGEPMRCASCHNHFENQDLTLARTISFASYFSEDDLELIRCGEHSGEFLAPKLPFALPEYDEGTPRTLKARKETAGLWLVDPTNDRFAEVMANRIWKRYFGVGLYEPADEWSSDIEASHPDLLRWLADDFRSNGFDVKRTVRLILTSRTYRHALDSAHPTTFDRAAPDAPRYFASPGLRRLTAEQYWDSAREVLGMPWQGAHRTYQSWNRVFQMVRPPSLVIAMGAPIVRREAQTDRIDNASAKQALLMMNGESFNDLIADSPALSNIIDSFNRHQELNTALRDVYRLVLSREPSADEQRIAEQYFADLVDEPSQTKAFVQDTCWSLLTSPEFLFVP